MYQYLFKLKKKTSQKKFYHYRYPVVVPYLFCLIWIFFMPVVMASLKAEEIQWDTQATKIIGDFEDSDKRKVIEDQIKTQNETIFHRWTEEIESLKKDKKLGNYKRLGDDCRFSFAPNSLMSWESLWWEHVALTTSSEGKNWLDVKCFPVGVCMITINVFSPSEYTSKKPIAYFFLRYDYNTKKHEFHLDLQPHINTLQEAPSKTEETNTSLEQKLKNAEETNTSLEQKLRDAEEISTDTEEKAKEVKQKLKDAEKTISRLIYLLIAALVIILGFGILVRHMSAKNTKEELHVVQLEDRTTRHESIPQHSPKNYTPILVRDSYYEEQCTNSQATVMTSNLEKEKTLSTTTQSVTEDEEKADTEEENTLSTATQSATEDEEKEFTEEFSNTVTEEEKVVSISTQSVIEDEEKEVTEESLNTEEEEEKKTVSTTFQTVTIDEEKDFTEESSDKQN